MHKPSTTRLYCESVFLAGLVCLPFVAGGANLGWIARQPLTFAILGIGVVLGEMLPIKIPRRGAEEELTFSASFALALLLTGGLAPAIAPLALASVLQDVRARKPVWRLRFNLGQYTLSMVLAETVLRAVMATSHVNLSHPTDGRPLRALLLGVGTFFIVNEILVGIAVATHQGASIRRYFRNDLGFVLATDGVVVLVSPIVLAVAVYSVALVPLCLAPILAVYNSIRRGVRSEHAARHDLLTGLPNRAGFQAAGVAALDRGKACVLLLDLDRFKEINDTLGHHAGDGLLVGVAGRFREALDAGGVISRLGGDEFAVVSAGCDRAGAEALAQRLADALDEPFDLDGIVLDVQASIGIALYPDDGDSLETLLQKADVAMYCAKQTRIDWSLYEEQHDHHSPARLSLATELRSAVQRRDEIVPVFQPEIDVRTGEVVAVEALARWRHPTLGLLGPDDFIGLAENTKIIKPLTLRFIEEALAHLATWRHRELELTVAVNVSAQVLVDRNFAEAVKAALRQADVPPTLLKIEVTESALMAEPIIARAVLAELSAFGIEISIDDFGTGYSSLAYLADLPVSEVKIDRSFVAAVDSGVGKRIIVSSTVDLAHNLGMRAVAEGVSDLAWLPALEALGCDAVQGFAIAQPMPGEEVVDWVAGFDRRTVVRRIGAIGVPRGIGCGPVAERIAAAGQAAAVRLDSEGIVRARGEWAGTRLPAAPSIV